MDGWRKRLGRVICGNIFVVVWVVVLSLRL